MDEMEKEDDLDEFYLRNAPCTLETSRAYDASEAKWEEVQALQAQLDDAVEVMFRLSSGPHSGAAHPARRAGGGGAPRPSP